VYITIYVLVIIAEILQKLITSARILYIDYIEITQNSLIFYETK